MDRGAVIDHRQVANAVRVHQPQAVGKRMGQISFDNVSDHNVRYGCGLRGFPRQHQLPQAIAFGKNADDRSALYDDEESNVLFSLRRTAVSTLSPGPTVHSACDLAATICFNDR